MPTPPVAPALCRFVEAKLDTYDPATSRVPAESVLFALLLRPLPGAVPPEVRLRRGLKALLRGCGLRCVAARQVGPGEGAAVGGKALPAGDAPALPGEVAP